MARYRNSLPQLGDKLFLADGGIETSLIYLEGINLPEFASFPLLLTPEGEAALRRYFLPYLQLAHEYRTGLVLESATWRASADWGAKLGYSASQLADVNHRSMHMLEDLRRTWETPQTPIVISGCIGPRGDGYIPASAMSAHEAADFHGAQVSVFADTNADMVCALTMNYVEEAIGVSVAAQRYAMPVAISFTVETDGLLPTGHTLQSAIEQVDAETDGWPAYFMINCAHPTHFAPVLRDGGAWLERIRGIRANASHRSHAELNEATELDIGDPVEFGGLYSKLAATMPNLNVMGGCCGTDQRHLAQVAACCARSATARGSLE
jgi:S-methylmethionine-dependent homocysteine/selenocysteine methylase